MRRTTQHLAWLGVMAIGLGVGASALGSSFVERFRHLKDAIAPQLALPEAKQRVHQFEMFSKPTEVVMLGDSLVEHGLWNEMFHGVSIANRGVHGDLTEDMLRRIGTVTSVQPRKVFIMAGSSDILRGRSNAEIAGNYRSIIRQLAKTGATIYVQSAVECSQQRCGYKLSRLRELNGVLRKLATEEGVYFIDLNLTMAAADSGLKPEFTFDGLNLDGDGYAAWAAALHPYMTN